jgi:hypothetical protein
MLLNLLFNNTIIVFSLEVHFKKFLSKYYTKKPSLYKL